jgi:hypothetical protein
MDGLNKYKKELREGMKRVKIILIYQQIIISITSISPPITTSPTHLVKFTK